MAAISPHYVKPTHGTALKNVIEESALLDEFVEMVKMKLDFDGQHLSNLERLRASWNEGWHRPGIGALTSPILKHFEEEIANLTQTRDRLEELWHSILYAPKLDLKEEGDFVPLEVAQTLETLFIKCFESHQEVSSVDGKAKLRSWYERQIRPTTRSTNLVTSFPQIDRMYRKNVTAQQRYVEKASNWYKHDVEEILDSHQQRAENIKKRLHGFLYIQSSLLSNSLASCSTATRSIDAFSSPQFIATRHDEVSQERNHLLLQKFPYHCYYRNYEGEVMKPIFGLGIENMVPFVGLILDTLGTHWRVWPHCMEWLLMYSRVDHMLELERRLLREQDMRTVLDKMCRKWPGFMVLYLQYALWNEDPLLPISDQQITQYKYHHRRSFSLDFRRSPEATSRRKMEPVTRLIDSPIPDQVTQIVSSILDGLMNVASARGFASLLLTHKEDADVIIEDIWRKWDLANNCPIQVERPIHDRTAGSTPVIKLVSTGNGIRIEPVPYPASFLLRDTGSNYNGFFADMRYRIEKHVGTSGKHAQFEGTDMVTKVPVTIKMELSRPQNKDELLTCLRNVHRWYKQLKDLHFEIPKTFLFQDRDSGDCLVTERFGPNLDVLFKICDNRFSVKTVAMLAIRLITLFESVYRRDDFTMDVKPQNFVSRLNKNSGKIGFAFDLDKTKDSFLRLKDHETASDIPSNGDERFLPVHTRRGRPHHVVEGSLEALGYMLVYFLRGRLPWQELEEENPVMQREAIAAMKRDIPVDELCEGLPEGFMVYFERLRIFTDFQTYTFTSDFIFDSFDGLFEQMLKDLGESDDGIFDWVQLQSEQAVVA